MNIELRGKLSDHIEVCCGGESDRIVGELGDYGQRAHKAEQTHFEDWVFNQ